MCISGIDLRSPLHPSCRKMRSQLVAYSTRLLHGADASVWTCALRSSAPKLYQAQRWVKFVPVSSRQRARCKTGQITFQCRSCVRVAANPSTTTPIGAAPHSGLDGLNGIAALWVWRWMLQARAESKAAVRRLEQQPSYKASTSERHSATHCTLSKRKRRREGRVEFVWRAVAENPFEHHVVKIILTEDSIVVPTGLSHVSDRALASRGIARESVAARASAACKATISASTMQTQRYGFDASGLHQFLHASV